MIKKFISMSFEYMYKKKILIVCRAFYPEISPRSFRATELAKEFARQGHEVTVIFPTHGRDYSEFQKEHNVNIKDLGKLKFKGIELKGKGLELLIRRAIRRIMNLFFEYPDIELMFKVTRALRNEKGYDLLISIAVPHPIHWGVARAWKKNQQIAKTWVADCGDPYMLARLDTFNKLFYFKYFEKDFCRKCDFITVPVETAIKGYYPEFHFKIKEIPQGFNFDELQIPEYRKASDYPTFAYAGSFIPGKRDPRPFLEYLCKLNRPFKFYVYTSHQSILMTFKEKLNSRLEIMRPVPRNELLKILATMDFLVNFDNNTDEQIPSKLIDYALTTRPVLNITKDTDLNIVNDFLNGNYEKKMKINNIEKYNIRNVAKQFIDLL